MQFRFCIYIDSGRNCREGQTVCIGIWQVMKMRIGSKRINISGSLPLLYLIAAGVILGILLMNLGRKTLFQETGLLDQESLYHMKYMTVDNNALFWYVLCMRLKSTVVLAILSTTYLGLAAVCVAAVGWGTGAGMFLTAAFVRYGVKGIVLAITSVFPQYLLYGPACFFLMRWCEQICRAIYFEKGRQLTGKQVFLTKLLQLLGVMAVVIIGAVLESYVNPSLLKKLLKNF